MNTRTTIEQRGVVRFLWAKDMAAKDIHEDAAYVRWTLPVMSSSPLKQHLSGERFPDDDAVERAVCARGSDSNHKNFTPQVSRDLWNGGKSV